MSTYDVTAQVKEILASGMTLQQIADHINAGGNRWLITDGDELIQATAWNRVSQDRIYTLRDQVRAAAAREVERDLPRPITTPMATDRQVDYLVTLLARKYRSGELDGFASWTQYITDTEIDVKALRALTRDRASQLITSLKGDY